MCARSAPRRIHRSRLAGAALAIAFVLAAPAHAESVHALTLASQPLDRALQEFARVSGLQLVYRSRITRGRQAPAVKGSYTTSEALDVLLAGSQLGYRFIDEHTIEVRPQLALRSQRTSRNPATTSPSAGHAAAAQVEEVVVIGTAEGLAATRVPTPLREIPQTISIVGSEQLRQQDDIDVSRALSRAPGITTRRASSEDTDIYIRGFRMSAVHMDGGPALQQINPAYRYGAPDLSEIDRIEVLRGADGLFTGRGDPGGSVNLVRKRPLREPALEVSSSAGSWDDYRVKLDATGPLALDGALRGRLIGAYVDRGYFYDTAHLQRNKVFGVLEIDLTRAAALTAGGSYKADDAIVMLEGLPRFADGSDPHLPRNLALTTPWSRHETHSREAYVQYRQRFDNGWQLNAQGSAGDARSDKTAFFTSTPIDRATGGLYGRPQILRQGEFEKRLYSFLFTLTGDLNLWGGRQQFVVGGDYVHQGFDTHAWPTDGYLPGSPVADLAHFDPDLYPQPQILLLPTHAGSTREDIGVFASLQVDLGDAWSIVAGARSLRGSKATFADALSFTQRFGPIATPYAALMYELGERWSAYASYADVAIEEDNMRRSRDGRTRASHGANVEVGLKGAWHDGALNATIAAYRIRQYATPVYVAGTPQAPVGGYEFGVNESDGIELEIAGAVKPQWLISAGYTYNENRSAEAQLGILTWGRKLSSWTPKHLLKAWTSYRLPGALNRWTLGGYLHAQTAISQTSLACDLWSSLGCARTTHTLLTVNQDAYAVLDLRVGFDLGKRWRLAASIDNVFDKRYFESVGTAANGNWYGEPRSLTVQFGAEF